MSVYLPFFICLAIVVGGVAGTLPSCPRTGVPPFARTKLLARLGYGYDPKKVTFAKNGFVNPVIALTDKGHTIRFPDPSKLTLPLPCEASLSHHFIHGDQRYSLDKVITSYEQYQSLFSAGGSIGAVGQVLPVSGSFSGSYTRNSLLNQKSVVILQYRSRRQGEAWLDPAIDSPIEAKVLQWWTPAFNNAVNDLNASNFSDSSYSRLINRFGTHVVYRVTVGSYIEVNANMDYCEYETLKNAEGAAKVRADLLGTLTAEVKAHANSSSSSTKTGLTQFNSNNRAGGNDPAFLKTGDINQYMANADQVNTPAIIPQETRFIEIWNLLQVSDGRRELLKKAVQAYIGPQPTPVTDTQCSLSASAARVASPTHVASPARVAIASSTRVVIASPTHCGARKPWLSPFAFVFTAIFLCVLY